MPKLIANRQLLGSYGNIAPNEVFDAPDDVARALESKGLARRAGVRPEVTYETKIITPAAPGVSAREPFRNVPVPDKGPEAVAAKGDSVLPKPDVPKPRAADRGVRGRRKGSGTKR